MAVQLDVQNDVEKYVYLFSGPFANIFMNTLVHMLDEDETMLGMFKYDHVLLCNLPVEYSTYNQPTYCIFNLTFTPDYLIQKDLIGKSGANPSFPNSIHSSTFSLLLNFVDKLTPPYTRLGKCYYSAHQQHQHTLEYPELENTESKPNPSKLFSSPFSMHLRPDHAVLDLPTLHAFIRAHPLGVLTTSLPSEKFPTLQCSHIPWVLDVDVDSSDTLQTGTESETTATRECGTCDALHGATASDITSPLNPFGLGILRGHIARANPQTAAMIEAVTDARPATTTGSSVTPPERDSAGSADHVQGQATGPGAGAGAGAGADYYLPGEVLIIFTSPVDHYITPHFYTAAKAATATATATATAATGTGSGKSRARIAPTWNYAAVQVYGRMRVFHDSSVEETGVFLQRQLSDLARLGEEGVMGFADGRNSTYSHGDDHGYDHGYGTSPSPWTLDDAPEKFIALLKKNIVGMRVEITRVEGRFKVSQERPVGDREGVVKGLEGVGGGTAKRMAEFVRKGRVV